MTVSSFVGCRDLESSVALLCGLSVDWAERYYREGRITQDEWEGYRHAWAHFNPHSSLAAGWAHGEAFHWPLCIAVGLVNVLSH